MLSPSFFRTFRGKSGPCLQFFLQPQPEICKRMHFQYPRGDYNASQCTTEVPFSISIRFWLGASCPSGVLHRVALPRKNCPTEVGPPLRQHHRQCVVRMWHDVTRSIAGTNHAESRDYGHYMATCCSYSTLFQFKFLRAFVRSRKS